jgi:carbon-monoxide dehydrogenase medium subunit
MTISHEFEYSKHNSLEDTLEDLAEHGSKASLLAGGTDLINWLKEDLITPERLIDIKALKDLKKITFKNNILSIGAGVTFTEIIESNIIQDHFPVLAEMANKVASVGVRNRATIGGNICSAVPCCDSGPVLLAYDAEVIIMHDKYDADVPLTSFFKGPRQTVLKNDELLYEFRIKKPESHGASFLKLGRYKGEDLAQASVCVVALSDTEYRVAFGAVSASPIRATKIENLLNGKILTDRIIDEALALVPDVISPITDIRASKEYREHMVQVMLKRGLKAAESRRNGEGPNYTSNLI